MRGNFFQMTETATPEEQSHQVLSVVPPAGGDDGVKMGEGRESDADKKKKLIKVHFFGLKTSS